MSLSDEWVSVSSRGKTQVVGLETLSPEAEAVCMHTPVCFTVETTVTDILQG